MTLTGSNESKHFSLIMNRDDSGAARLWPIFKAASRVFIVVDSYDRRLADFFTVGNHPSRVTFLEKGVNTDTFFGREIWVSFFFSASAEGLSCTILKIAKKVSRKKKMSSYNSSKFI